MSESQNKSNCTRLIVMRHAKSDWDAAVSDFDRPLNERGRNNAEVAGDYLRNIHIDHAVVSPSVRTQETWRQLGLDVPMTTDPTLYHANAASILASVIEGVAVADLTLTGTLLVLSHNPGSAELVDRLIDSVPSKFDRWEVDRFPTAAIAVIDYGTTWTDLAAGPTGELLEGAGILTDFVVPR